MPSGFISFIFIAIMSTNYLVLKVKYNVYAMGAKGIRSFQGNFGLPSKTCTVNIFYSLAVKYFSLCHFGFVSFCAFSKNVLNLFAADLWISQLLELC